MSKGKFGTAINCMDGRVQLPVINWMKEKYHLDFVDSITEPGPDKIIATKQIEFLNSIKSRIHISVDKHHSEVILIAGHHDCAGNPVTKEEHIAHIRQAIEVIHSWNLPVSTIIGAWLGEDWEVEVITIMEK